MKPLIQSLDQCELMLGELGQLRASVTTIEENYDRQIAVLQSKKAVDTQPIEGNIRALETHLLVFVKANMHLIRVDGKKSREFSTGSIKTKDTEKWNYPKNEDLIAAIEDHFRADASRYLNVKTEPQKSVLKQYLKKHPDELDALEIERYTETEITLETV